MGFVFLAFFHMLFTADWSGCFCFFFFSILSFSYCFRSSNFYLRRVSCSDAFLKLADACFNYWSGTLLTANDCFNYGSGFLLVANDCFHYELGGLLYNVVVVAGLVFILGDGTAVDKFAASVVRGNLFLLSLSIISANQLLKSSNSSYSFLYTSGFLPSNPIFPIMFF